MGTAVKVSYVKVSPPKDDGYDSDHTIVDGLSTEECNVSLCLRALNVPTDEADRIESTLQEWVGDTEDKAMAICYEKRERIRYNRPLSAGQFVATKRFATESSDLYVVAELQHELVDLTEAQTTE